VCRVRCGKARAPLSQISSLTAFPEAFSLESGTRRLEWPLPSPPRLAGLRRGLFFLVFFRAGGVRGRSAARAQRGCRGLPFAGGRGVARPWCVRAWRTLSRRH